MSQRWGYSNPKYSSPASLNYVSSVSEAAYWMLEKRNWYSHENIYSIALELKWITHSDGHIH